MKIAVPITLYFDVKIPGNDAVFLQLQTTTDEDALGEKT